MKRVLIITYYWPPSAGSGVQRWLKFSKFLPEFGWQPVIFTPENPDFALQDHSLEAKVGADTEVMKFPIWEPYQLFRRIRKGEIKDTSRILEQKAPSLLDQVAVWLRGNALIPDPRRFWVKPSVEFLQRIWEDNAFEAIITTGPPHSMHLIGRNLKRKTGTPWLADFRDPWSTWEFLDTLKLTSVARNKHRKLEMSVFREADALVTISPTFAREMEQLASRKFHVLTNGFDPEDLPAGFSPAADPGEILEIVYTGVIDSIRNPFPFLQALKEVFGSSRNRVRLTFVGKVSQQLQDRIREDDWLQEHLHLTGYLNHGEVFSYYEKAHRLLLILTQTKNARGNIPGKLFEYMATGREIIGMGDPEGDAAKIIAQAGAGKVFAHEDIAGLIGYLSDLRSLPEAKKQENQGQRFHRRNLTRQLADLLQGMLNA
ncbi:Glycosyltransferase involved in cell wall bisynthesis [Cyclobacterium xiamenense]|uniref:Glycosyltransferase involved in cell wall bisynthesis n=1 Tax=Cyclobacterium xiamenense TaxID=1297121 RepID=A0A1H6ZXV5_9BACT|nr:glycosyltransferase family 4 protein [Cyclobacterium xiamenense]SEJ58181.1 Glycosyltransferase involved in cell wall bisynthesis [Cyclobacterium xiamenense]